MSQVPKLLKKRKGKSITLTSWENGGKKSRLLRRLSLSVILGKTNNQIARELNVAYTTISKWMQDPEVQEYIQEMETNYYTQVERDYTRLMKDSVMRARRILKNGKDADAIEVIDKVWKGQGKLPVPKGSETPAMNQQVLVQGGGSMMERPDAQYALEWLRKTREESRKLEGVEE